MLMLLSRSGYIFKEADMESIFNYITQNATKHIRITHAAIHNSDNGTHKITLNWVKKTFSACSI